MRNRFHSICPYFAMFPESFAEKWIERLSKPGEIVMDPFCGRGTTPFQAVLMGRRAIGADVNPVAYCITKAKTGPPSKSSVMRRITILERAFRAHDWEPARAKMPPFFRHAYAPSTLRQILYLRETLRWRDSSVDTMIAALMLGALHGESGKSSSYLSNQMPRVISTKPAYSIRFWQKHGLRAPKRDAFALLRNRAEFRYETGLPRTEQVWTYCTDMRELPATLKTLAEPIRCVITSPPYLDVTSFEEDQWLRLWFLGGMRKPTRGRLSKDDRHESPACYWNFISDMWRVFGQSLSKKAQIVIRLGGKGTSAQQAVEGLKATSLFSGRKVRLVSSEISEIARRQTHSFRPGSKGCRLEVDCHFQMA